VSVEHIEFLVEEPSMEAFLEGLLPTLLGGVSFAIYPSQGKMDLLERLPARLRGYASWLPHSWRIVVLLDRDDDDCRALKRKLGDIARRGGFPARSATRRSITNRIAIEELEAWYFGDWDAVRAAYPKAPPGVPGRAWCRDPDAVRGGTWEAFERVLQRCGYFGGGLRKIEAARAIAPHIQRTRTRSRSFKVFCDAMIAMCGVS
jgi:hypothetical protein